MCADTGETTSYVEHLAMSKGVLNWSPTRLKSRNIRTVFALTSDYLSKSTNSHKAEPIDLNDRSYQQSTS